MRFLNGSQVSTPSGAAFWNGLIDEVEIHDRALTQEEIRAIFEAGSAGKCKDDDDDGRVGQSRRLSRQPRPVTSDMSPLPGIDLSPQRLSPSTRKWVTPPIVDRLDAAGHR